MTTEMAVTTTVTTTATKTRKGRLRKPTRRLVCQLERELDQVRESNRQTVASLSSVLTRKSDELIVALNERDEARNQRDVAKSDAFTVRRLAVADCEEHEQAERELRGDLSRLQAAHDELARNYRELYELNQHNFDKAERYSDVAAVLASVIVSETDEGPKKTMKRFISTAIRMGVSPEVLNDAEAAVMRGFAAQIKEASVIASREVEEEIETETSSVLQQRIVDYEDREDVLSALQEMRLTPMPGNGFDSFGR